MRPRIDYYREESRRIMEIVAETGAVVELMSIDEAYLDMSSVVRNRLVVKNVIFKKYPSSQRMFALANECLDIMNQFGKFQVIWKGRANNVERFGH